MKKRSSVLSTTMLAISFCALFSNSVLAEGEKSAIAEKVTVTYAQTEKQSIPSVMFTKIDIKALEELEVKQASKSLESVKAGGAAQNTIYGLALGGLLVLVLALGA